MSTITIINNASNGEVVRIALYKKPLSQPNLQSIAWKVIAPPPSGGCTTVNIPDVYEAYASYSLDPAERNDPNAGSRTQVLPFGENTARFLINSTDSQDRRASAASIVQTFDGLVLNEVRMENNFGVGVWGHITKDGDEVYPPQVIWPSGVRMEDVRSSFFVAVVAQFVNKGARLVDAEISVTEAEVLEGGTVIVTGSMWTGYNLSTV